MLREHHAKWWSSLLGFCPSYLPTAVYYIIPPLAHQMASHTIAMRAQHSGDRQTCPAPILAPISGLDLLIRWTAGFD